MKRTARLAGLLYLILGITGFYGIMYVSRQVIVPGDVAATTSKILSKEILFRTGIASHLISVVTFMSMAFVLYKLLRNVNAQQAKLMVALVVVQVPIVFLIETCRLTSLMTLKGEVLATLEPRQQQDLAMVLLKYHTYGIIVLEIFFGLWLVPFGLLVCRCGFIPRILGVLLIMAGAGYTIDSFTFILLPAYRSFTRIPALSLSAIGELSTILWLLIKGVRSSYADN